MTAPWRIETPVRIQDRTALKRIYLLIQDNQRNVNHGIGKPGISSMTARAIVGEESPANRLLDTVTDTEVRIAACRYHYGR